MTLLLIFLSSPVYAGLAIVPLPRYETVQKYENGEWVEHKIADYTPIRTTTTTTTTIEIRDEVEILNARIGDLENKIEVLQRQLLQLQRLLIMVFNLIRT